MVVVVVLAFAICWLPIHVSTIKHLALSANNQKCNAMHKVHSKFAKIYQNSKQSICYIAN